MYVDGFYEGSDRPATKAFVQAFREQHKDATITILDAVAFDTAQLLKQVIEKQKPQTPRGVPRARWPT